MNKSNHISGTAVLRSALALLAAAAGIPSGAQNPVFLGRAYNSDPQARVWKTETGDRLFIYGSRDESPSYYCSRKYDVFSTDDLVNWTGAESFSSKEVPYNGSMLYAPDCILKNGTYYLFYSQAGVSSVEGTAVSDSPYGPFLDGRPVVGADQIDPSVFIDDDGQAWMFWGQFSAKCAKLNPDMRSIDMSTFKDGIITESEHHFHEGIQVFKHDGTYYLVFADISRRGMPTCIGYATSDCITGPYKYRGVIIDNFGCDPAVWNNHGSVARFNGRWYVFYHRSSCGTGMMRNTCIEPIEILPDGTIPEVEMTSTGAGKPLDPFAPMDRSLVAGRACLLTGHVRIDRTFSLAQVRDGDTASWKSFFFKDKPRKMKISVCPVSGGWITVYSDYMYGTPVARFQVPEGDGLHFITLEAPTQVRPEGLTTLRMRFSGPEDRDLFTIGSFVFE